MELQASAVKENIHVKQSHLFYFVKTIYSKMHALKHKRHLKDKMSVFYVDGLWQNSELLS